VSEGIERGILVNYKKKCIVQEGMGLGAPAIKTRNGTFFSCNSKLTKISEKEYTKEFYIDSELIKIGDFLTKFFSNKIKDKIFWTLG